MAKETVSVPKKPSQSVDGIKKTITVKSYQESSKSFVTPDYADKSTWFYNATQVVDEVATTSDDTIYNFAPGGSVTVINLDKVTSRKDWLSSRNITIKKNDSIITSGFVVSPSSKTITFSQANQSSDVIKVSYSKENGSVYELLASAGKKIKLDYVESQFSSESTFNDSLVFELVLNNPSTGNNDYVAGQMEYKNAKDFLNIGNHGTVMAAFGELTKPVNVFPWNYLTGFVIKPVGDSTTDPTKNEFNKVRIYLKNNQVFTNCELATGTFYCLIEAL